MRANQRIHHKLELPPASSDVDYYSTVIYSIADCKIARNEFTKWAEGRGWQLNEVTSKDFTFFRHAVPETAEPEIIQTGMVFNAKDGDVGFWGAYDDATGRASISFSTR